MMMCGATKTRIRRMYELSADLSTAPVQAGASRKRGWLWCAIRLCVFAALYCMNAETAQAGSLEDLMLEKGQMTIDEWVQLKAEEEQRDSKTFEESRGVGDTPVKAKWYEHNIVKRQEECVELSPELFPQNEDVCVISFFSALVFYPH